MLLQVIESNSVGAGIRVDLSTTSNLYVAPDVIVGRTDGTTWGDYAITATGSFHRLDIHGTVVSPKVAINVGDQETDAASIVRIHEGAWVQSYDSDSAGVRMFGTALRLLNGGTITAEGDGVIMSVFNGVNSLIVNRGKIESLYGEGVSVYTSSNGTVTLENYGEITGPLSYQSQSMNCADRITNHGIMTGNILLNGGDDLYDGRKGTLVGVVGAGSGNDDLRGGKGAETFYGDSGNDQLSGGAGRDTLLGGVGKDVLSGGSGADIFVFEDVDDSLMPLASRDVILDFSQAQKDKIALPGLGSTETLVSIDTFAFIGADRFHKEAGELRYYQKGNNTFLQGDVDGDGKADFAVQFKGAIDFVESDFIF